MTAILTPAAFAQGPISVNTTADELNSDGDCSLREAIQAANTDNAVDACTAGSGADTISLPAGTYTLSLAGNGEDSNATGDLDITDDLTINGAGAATTVVSGNNLDRVFHITASDVSATFNNLTIRDGEARGNGDTGGGIKNDGGMVTVHQTSLRNNSSLRGGGIYSTGPLTITQSAIHDNLAEYTGSGSGVGGCLEQQASLYMANTTVSGNSTGYFSAGCLSVYKDATVIHSTISDNSGGYGIRVAYAYTLTAVSTVIANNTPGNCNVFGDGQYASAGYNLVSDNTCSGYGMNGSGDLHNTDPLLAALQDNGGDTWTSALQVGSPALDQIPNGVNGCGTTITTDQRGISRPDNSACDIGAFEGALAAPNTAPSFTSSPVTGVDQGQLYSYNITTSDPEDDSRTITAPTKPAWLTLVDNGNGTATLSGTPGSSDVGTHAVSLLVTDSGSLTDTQSFDVTVNAAGQVVCSETDLKNLLNGAGSVINLNGNCRYLLTSSSGSNGHLINLWNKTNLTIEGNGAVIERDNGAGDLGLLILIKASNVTIQNVTFKGGKATGGGLGRLGGGLALYRSSDTILRNVRFIGNEAIYGGGLGLYRGNTTVYNGVFADNYGRGAGLYADGDAVVENSTFTDNASNSAEAIFAWKTTSIKNSIIANHNVAIAAAGGSDNPVTEDHNIFSNNGQLKKLYNTGTTITSGGNSQTVSNVDQHFVDPGAYDFRLTASSPAIDKGVALNTTTDAAGNSRPFSSTQVDAGAFEYQGAGGPSLTIVKIAPYWVQANTTFVYKLTVANNGLAAASNLRITDTLPAGASFVGNASDGGSFNGNAVVWDIGSLAVGQVKTVQYEAQVSQSVTDGDYQVASTSDSSVSAEGEPVDTKVNSSLVASLGFFPNPDGFSFRNWGNPATDDHLTAADMFVLYGPGVCTAGTGGSKASCVLNAAGEQIRQSRLAFVTGGRCAGFTAGSVEFFLGEPFHNGKTTPTDFQSGAATTFELSSSTGVENMITFYAVSQFGRPVTPPPGTPGYGTLTDGTPKAVINYILTNGFDGPGDNDGYYLSIRRRDGTGGHAVTPYALENKGGGTYWLYVYDNNHPNNFERVVKINVNADTWIYEGVAVNPSAPSSTYEGDANSRTIYMRSVNNYTTYPKQCQFCPTTTGVQSSSQATGDIIEYALNGEGQLLVTNNANQRIGSDPDTGQTVNEISGAELLYLDNGLELNLPPRIIVPANNTYSIKVMNAENSFGNTSSEADLTISSPGFVATFRDLKIDSTDPLKAETQIGPYETMPLTFDPATKTVSFQASEVDTNTPALVLAIDDPAGGPGYIFHVSGLELATGTKVEMGFNVTSKKLTFEDNDTNQNQTYDMEVTQILSDGTQNTYQKNNVTGGSGAGAVLDFNGWDGQSDPPIEVLANSRLYLPFIVK